MTPERYKKISEHCRAVQEFEPGKREAYLEQACAGDDEMRREVQSLLGFQSKVESVIEENALVVEARQLEAEDLSMIKAQAGAGRQIGAYQILAPLGRGGMGEVYLALDTRLGRKVAVKLLPAEFTHDRERVRRFEQEARAASALEPSEHHHHLRDRRNLKARTTSSRNSLRARRCASE